MREYELTFERGKQNRFVCREEGEKTSLLSPRRTTANWQKEPYTVTEKTKKNLFFGGTFFLWGFKKKKQRISKFFFVIFK